MILIPLMNRKVYIPIKWSYLKLTAIKYDPLANPGRYISADHHVFENHFVRKQTACEDIDKLAEKKFDVYCNYMVPIKMTDSLRSAKYIDS